MYLDININYSYHTVILHLLVLATLSAGLPTVRPIGPFVGGRPQDDLFLRHVQNGVMPLKQLDIFTLWSKRSQPLPWTDFSTPYRGRSLSC